MKVICLNRNYKASTIIKYLTISKCKTVSFDVFDTLIKRAFAQPNDVMLRVARDYSEKTGKYIEPEKFLQDRINAATKAKTRLTSREEVTLDEIYSCMPNEYQELKALEIAREINCCRTSPVMKEVFDWCIKNIKRVFIISDMYLSVEVVEKILHQCGFTGYEKLYLSSDVGLKKSNEKLFQHVLTDSGITPSEHVHIGDAIRSDYLRARQSGMKAYKIPRHLHRSMYTGTLGLNRRNSEQYRKYQEVISNNINPEWNAYYLYGFEVIGMLLYGMCCWLHERFTQNNYDRVFFIARDGYIIQEAYNKLFGERAVKNSYLYVSRASLRFPLIWKGPTLQNIFGSLSVYILWHVEQVCDWLNIELKRGLVVWKDCGLYRDEGLFTGQLLNDERIKHFYEHFKQEIVAKSRQEYDTVKAYLNQEGFDDGYVAIVDIGWIGHIQLYLKQYLSNTDIYGYYFGFQEQEMVSSEAEAFIPKSLRPSNFCAALLEYPFTKCSGSTKSYLNKNQIIPVLDEYEFSGTEDEEITRQMQKGTLGFIELMRDGYGYEHIDYSTAYAKLRKITKSPSLKEAKILGKLNFIREGRKEKLAAPSRPLYYLLHPIKFKKDLLSSGWVIGFLKRLLKVSLPYDDLLSLLRR